MSDWKCECGFSIRGVSQPIFHACNPRVAIARPRRTSEPRPAEPIPVFECANRGEIIETHVCSGCWSRGNLVEVVVKECLVHGRCHEGPRNRAPTKAVGMPCWVCRASDEGFSPRLDS